jgi:hypothetical protein
MRSLYDRASVAKASTTEEPDAGILHVRVCAGRASGNGRSYVRSAQMTFLDKFGSTCPIIL